MLLLCISLKRAGSILSKMVEAPLLIHLSQEYSQFRLCQENVEKGQSLYGNSYSAWGRSVSRFGMQSITEILQPLCCNSVNVTEPQTNSILEPSLSKIETSLLSKTFVGLHYIVFFVN